MSTTSVVTKVKLFLLLCFIFFFISSCGVLFGPKPGTVEYVEQERAKKKKKEAKVAEKVNKAATKLFGISSLKQLVRR